MATNNLAVRKGRCINIGNCKKANVSEVIEIKLGDEFICPDCSGNLVEVREKSFPKWVIYAIIAVFVIGGAALLLTQGDTTPTHDPAHSPIPKTIVPETKPAPIVKVDDSDTEMTKDDSFSESTEIQQRQTSGVGVQQLDNSLVSTLIRIADNRNDELSRIRLVDPTLNNFFSPNAVVETYSQNGRTMLRRDNAREFLEWVSTSNKLINFRIMPESRIGANGKYTYLKITEIYE